MANVKITDLTAYTNPASTDVLPIVDVGADAGAGVTKQISIENLLKNAGSGTAEAPGFAFDGDSDTGIYRPGADQVALSTNGTGRLFVDAAGNVGIGTSSPVGNLDVRGPSGTTIIRAVGADTNGNADAEIFSTGTTGNSRLYFSDTAAQSGSIIYSHSNNSFAFATNGSSAVTIDSSQRVGIGTSSARANIDYEFGSSDALLQIEKANSTATASIVNNFSNATTRAGAQLILGRTGATSIGSNAIVSSDNVLGEVVFSGSDGSNLTRAALILAEVDGTPGANDMPGRLVFSTTAAGSPSPTERMRIDSDGTMLLGVNTKIIAKTTNPYLFFQAQSAVTTTGLPIESYGNNIATRYHFAFTNPNGVVGTISTNGTATAYNTSSDYRLKENVTPVTDGITRLQQLKPSRFNFIADPANTVDGFLAHEVQAVVPECVTGEKNAVDENGDPVYQGIDQSKLVPLLTAALQEAIGEIESLKARVAALESA